MVKGLKQGHQIKLGIETSVRPMFYADYVAIDYMILL